MVFAAMLHGALQDNDDGIQLKYRTYGRVFNLRRLKANTKVNVATLCDDVDNTCKIREETVEVPLCVYNFIPIFSTTVN